MREQGPESEWILSCQKSLRLMFGWRNDVCCHIFFFAVVVDVVAEFDIECALSELLYADDLVLMSETIEGVGNKFLKWKAFGRKGLKVNIGKTKVTVCGGIANYGLSKSKVSACGVYNMRVTAKSVLFVQCGKCVYGICGGVIRMNPMFSRNFAR